MATNYSKIERRIWNSRTFKKLSDDGKWLWLYLLSCPHGNILGLFVLKPGYAIADLGWESMERFTKAFGELLAIQLSNGLGKGLIKHDPDTDMVWIVNHLEHNPIENKNQALAAAKRVSDLPYSPLFQDVKLLIEQLGKQFLEPLIEQLGKQLGKPVAVAVAVTVTEEKKKDPAHNAPESKQCSKVNAQPKSNAQNKKAGLFLKTLNGQHFSNKFEDHFESIIKNLERIDGLTSKQKAFNHYKFTQYNINKVHPGALAETLLGIINYWDQVDDPWAYGMAILKTKNGNWNERDAIKDHQEINKQWNEALKTNPKIFKLIQGVLKTL